MLLLKCKRCAEGSDPVCQVTVNGIALLFKYASDAFILLLEADAPVIIDPIKAADDIKTAVVEKRIPVEVAVSGAQLQVRDRLNGNIRVHFGESFVECRNLRIDGERCPWQRRETHPVENV